MPPRSHEAAVIAPPAATRPPPYYECVFCKRGFTTAQALGGHMNIHRRDRDRVKPVQPTPHLDEPATKWYGHSASYPPSQLATSPMRSGSFAMLYYTGGAGAAAGVDADLAPLSPGTPSTRELSLFGSHDDHDRGCYWASVVMAGARRKGQSGGRTASQSGSWTWSSGSGLIPATDHYRPYGSAAHTQA